MMDTEIDTHNNRLRVLEAMKQELNFQQTHPHSHFNMGHWIARVDGSPNEDDQAWYEKEQPTLCKTSACIAGTAAVVLAPEQVFTWVEPSTSNPKGFWTVEDDVDWLDLGTELLGLNYDTASALFFRDNWPWYAREHGRESDLEAAIWLLQEIDNGNLEYDEYHWSHVEFGSSVDKELDEDEE